MTKFISKLISEADVCAALNRSYPTLRRWRKQGLKHVKIGGGVWYQPEALDRFIKSKSGGKN